MVDISLYNSGVQKSTLRLNSFNGVDFANNPFDVDVSRSPDALNMMPALNGAVACRHGYEKMFSVEGSINGIYELKSAKGSHILIHHGSNISEWNKDYSVGHKMEFTYSSNLTKGTVYCFGITYSSDIKADNFAIFCPSYDIIAPESGTKIEYYFDDGILIINGYFEPSVVSETISGESISQKQVTGSVDGIEIIRIAGSLPDTKSSGAIMNNALYIFTGQTAYIYEQYDFTDDTGNNLGKFYKLNKLQDVAYVPAVLIACSPIKTKKQYASSNPVDSGGGAGPDSTYEAINLLSNKRKEMFTVTEASTSDTPLGSSTGTWYYKLPLSTAPIENVIEVETYNGSTAQWEVVPATDYTVDKENGIVIFNSSLQVTPLSDIGAMDNYRVTYEVGWQGTYEQITVGKEIFVSSKSDYNFNPPILDNYSHADDYNDYKSGKKFTTYKLRLLLGNDIADPDNIKVHYIFKNENNPNGIWFDYDTDGNDERIAATTLIAGTTPTEHQILLPKSGEYALTGLPPDSSSSDAAKYAYYRMYTAVVLEGSDYYLDVTTPYAIFTTYIDKDDERVIDYIPYSTDGGNLIKADFSRKKYSYQDRINKATICTKFGYGGNMDRVFVSGYYDMPEYEFWSEIDNPKYFPDLNYAALGDSDTAVMGWSRMDNNQLAVHKSSNYSDPTIYIQNAVLNDDFTVDFPVREGASGVGVVSSRAFGVLNGEPLALSKDGVFAPRLVEDIAADVTYAAPRSYYINPKLQEMDLSDAEAVVFNTMYYLAVGGYVFVANGKQKYFVGGKQGYDYSYEWFLLDNIPANIWWVHDDELYFGTKDGMVCKFNDGYMDIDKPVNCYWTTPFLNFGTTPYYKKVKNVIVSCVLPTTDFSEVNIDYIDLKRVRTVKSYLIDNTSKKTGMVQSIATNYKVKKVTGMQVRVRANNAENFNLCDISILYTTTGKFKG